MPPDDDDAIQGGVHSGSDRDPDFEALTPDVVIDAIEHAVDQRLTGLTTPLPSYINRVYEVQTESGERLVAKFYRPGRWSREALADELAFVGDCAEDEIPVVTPLTGPGGRMLHEADGIFFTVLPKRHGRQLEITRDEDWLRIGRLLGRVHVAGSRKAAAHRTDLHPERTISDHVCHLVEGGYVTRRHRPAFEMITSRILERIGGLFESVEFVRIHGDCHCGNLLDRLEEGLVIIDFDDMMMGPPVQDFWLLLPDRLEHCRRELNLLLEGYERFREFDDRTLVLVEPLRAMRIIYFLAWCSHQVHDYRFQHLYPEWGKDAFWEREINDLQTQLQFIENALSSRF